MPESSSLHRLFALARRALPESVYGAARALGNLALTPLLFSYYTGHARSALRGRAVDRHGQPVTWYTLPMNELLSAKDFADREILELGGGQSTLWWAARARRVVCLEADPAWYQHLRGLVPANVELHLCTDFAALEQALAGRRFDLVLVDGLSVLDAAGQCGISVQGANQAVLRCRRAMKLAKARPIAATAAPRSSPPTPPCGRSGAARTATASPPARLGLRTSRT